MVILEGIMEISAAEFKAKCLKIMDTVQHTREEVLITKRGKPIARLLPAGAPTPRSPFGCMEKRASMTDDLIASTGEVWDADNEV